jgi:hypothetical protein
VSSSIPSRAKAALWRFSGRWSANLPTRIMASRLGPAKPRGIGCDGAGGSVIASQSRQANFSRTRSMIFHRRGSHSSVLETTSPSLRSRDPPHLPHAQGAGSTMRSIGRLSGSLRGPRGWRRRCALAVSGAAISALASSSACVSSRSSTPVRAARRAACRAPKMGRNAHGAPWPGAASDARSPGRGSSLRSARRPTSRAAPGSSRERSPGRSEARSAGRRRVVRRSPSRRQQEHIRQQKSPTKHPLSQLAAVTRPPWDATISAAFANRCRKGDNRVAPPRSSPRLRRPTATGTVRAPAA